MTEAQLPPDLDRGITAMRDAIAFVERRVINRASVVKRIFAALLTREHVLLQARTGVGKSLLAHQVFAMFTGASIFEVQASKEQQPDTYFGALDLDELKRGKIWHNTEGSLVEAQFGFIDEIFDANDYTLRALLTLLNERRLVRGVQNVASPLHTVVGATNYVRVSQVTEALLDRFLYKAVVESDRDPFFMYRISQQFIRHRGHVAAAPATITFDILKRLSDIVRGHSEEIEMHVPRSVMFFANLVLRHYESLHQRADKDRRKGDGSGAEFRISPRTQAKALDALRAIAIMNRRLDVRIEDVGRLNIVLCTGGIAEEKDMFRKAYESLRQQYTATHALDQLRDLLDLQDLIDRVTDDRKLLEQPISELTTTAVKKTVTDWAREKLGIQHTGPEHNRRLLTAFLEEIDPLTDEIRLIKKRLEAEVHEIFAADVTWG